MLQTLRVKNFAIVKELEVGFEKGLNVITGETGAGKSILIGALGLVLGERADKDMIRAGEDRCGVEAVFQLSDPASIDNVLEELGLETCENGRLIIRRIVSSGGNSKNVVNDCPTTVQALARIGSLLVDMHGPHDHQSLFSREFQLSLLDSYGHLWKSRELYEETYRTLLDLEKKRQTLDGSDRETTTRIELLSYQIKEIESANLTEFDSADLDQEHQVTANAGRILELGQGALQALIEAETSAFTAMSAVQNALQEIGGLMDSAEEWEKEARTISIQIQELSSSIQRRIENIEADPSRLQWLEDRKALLHKLKKKYGATVPEILQTLARAREELQDLETRGQQIEALDAQIREIRKTLETRGRALGKERSAASGKLAAAVTRELQNLGFPRGAFGVRLQEAEPALSGMDDVEFEFGPNPGEPRRALRSIASSGEISRVMLATKAVLAAHDQIPILVFDEVDANVGGEMGTAIGLKLTAVAKTHQVLCITHLPQVAVHGTTHLVVAKDVHDERTWTRINAITGKERVEEIARMLGGKDLTSVTLKHAREMLENA